MAKRKRRGTKRSSSSPRRVTTAVKKARRRRRGLSAGGGKKAAIMTTVKTLGFGAAGGAAVALVDKVTKSQSKPIQYGAIAGLALVSSMVLKQPDVTAGIGGALGYKLAKEIPFLNEDAYFADEDALADEPVFMSEDGEPLYLSENGDLIPLEEIEEAEYVEI